jgi:hypothetical protein
MAATLPPVNPLLRLVLTCLLALALPLQGYAAGSMLLCGPLHQGQASVGQAQPADAHQHHAAHADEASAHAAHDAVQPDAHGADDGAGQVIAKCSLCAACCASAAIVPQAVVLGALPAQSSYVALQTEARAGFTPGGIERPPRAFLA